jgi:hypothetical protein
MKARYVVAIMLLLVPALADAQGRLPRIGRRPGRPAELPPQPPSVARELAYKRLPYSVESYPLISHFVATGFVAEGVTTSWTSGGLGQRADYRLARNASITVDMTSAFLGGPARTSTFEVGTRLRPERNERRLYPFVDLRVGYANAYDSFYRPGDFADPLTPTGSVYGSRFSHGVGAIAGAGLEIALTRTLSITTAASALRARMRTSNFRSASAGTDRPYLMTSTRYALGLRWNPVKVMRRDDLSATGLPGGN